MLASHELREAIREAITNHIPFEPPSDTEFSLLEHAVYDMAAELGYVRAYPHEFKHKAWAFYLSAELGLRWGYVRNETKVGWFEGRETTPLPKRARVTKDAEQVYGHKADLLSPRASLA